MEEPIRKAVSLKATVKPVIETLSTATKASAAHRALNVATADTENFDKLFRISGLDPRRHCRLSDWTGISFAGSNLRGYDFTGARLVRCSFSGSKIEGCRFDHAEIDIARPNASLDPGRSNLRAALDWAAYSKSWHRAESTPHDDHLSMGMVFQDAPFSPEMVIVPSGTFLMGSRDGEPDRQVFEGPQRVVTIEHSFAVGRFSVTIDEWIEFSIRTGRIVPLTRGPSLGRQPVVDVNWRDANDYVNWLSDMTGKKYRLLTEAEWEYVCRAGTLTAYSVGDSITQAHANFRTKSTVAVGSFLSNAWGLYEMHGNVWEWCQDEWHASYDQAPIDGSAWQEKSSGGRRVVRGGSWGYHGRFLRSAYRGKDGNAAKSNGLGIRVARQLSFA